METSDVVISVIFMSQTVVGILGNSFLVYHYLMLYFMGCRLKFTDWILQHLIVANFLTLLCKGVPHIVSAFGWKDFFNDTECKLIFYLHRIGRGVSISSTCFLSVFQAITISPKTARWTQLKVKSHSSIASCVYMSWALSFLINIAFPIKMRAIQYNKNITHQRVYEHCSSVQHDKTTDIVSAIFLTLPDVLLMLLMIWSSSYMVFILYRHKQRMKHIHRSNFSFRSSPEFRVTKTIMLLVSTFVFFYTVSCVLQINIALGHNLTFLWVNMATVVIACFPTVSPFLVISR
ncbi:vomeronasal V1r-type receptor V1rf3 [Rattus norvegicus]|uniref:Vomeronasal type-1 receptor n=2 Tax=Rattus norvegicus TaxID=10116 RepID=Q5J3H1_RAT|nr:vomeronasal type-1 receptor 4 [Rattus norvegicus]EDL99777.1 vomeronasal V1r-type receptor V1rf3 [Rattus norvegicus]|eukprot:NP_001009510.1 vomeronasal type-1 receptor 4 [Rattus norvegicus]